MQRMAQLGTASRRGFWLAIGLAGIAFLSTLLMPLAAIGVVVWLAVAWGIRRSHWAAAMAGTGIMAIGMVVGMVHFSSDGVASFVVSTLFAAVCGYIFLRATLELKDDDRGSSWAWVWVAWVCGNGVFWVCFGVYSTASASMESTLLQNESVLVDQASWRLGRMPRRDEMVVFHYPVQPKEIYLKRVAGVAGDRVKLVNKQLIRNGAPVAEPYVLHATAYTDAYRDNFPGPAPATSLPPQAVDMLRNHVRNGEVVVPAGEYFVLGDNRDDSFDSRYWGFVSAREIIGRPFLIYASYNLDGGPDSKSMASIFNTRWGRLLKIL